MAEPKVSILLQLVDKMTQPMDGARASISKFGASLKGLGNEAMELLNNKLIQGVGLAGLGAGLLKAFEASDQFRVALQKLEGAAKITGTPLEVLTGLADKAEQAFGLTKGQAADLSVEMVKLASKAGDVGKAGPALQSFLDIGAARGLSAEETLKAVQQAILGIDEGTDKLFNANPSVLYERFAESIGTTAAKLTDQEKAQALLNAAMEDGGKVIGEYGKYLETTAGQAQLAKNQSTAFLAELGQALDPARRAFLEFAATVVAKAREFVGGMQLLGAGAAELFLGLPDRFKMMWGNFLVAVSNTIGESRVLLTLFGDDLTEVADKLGATGTTMVRESRINLTHLKEGYEATVAEIVGTVQGGERATTAAVKQGGTLRLASTSATNKATEAEVKRSHKALQDLEEYAAKTTLQTLSTQQREYLELVRVFRSKMEGMTAEDRAKAEQLLKDEHTKLLLKWAKLDQDLKPVMREIGMTLKGPILDFGSVVEDTAEDAGDDFDAMNNRIAETAYQIADAAFAMSDFAQQAGVADSQIAGLAEGIGRLAEGIGGIASGDLLGGIQSAVSGLQGIVGSLFGDSPAERARKALLAKNTEALLKLRDSVGDLERTMTPGAQIAGFQQLSQANRDKLAAYGDAFKTHGGIKTSEFAKILAGMGVTISQMESVAKDMGIDLGAADGRIDGDAIRSFFDAISAFEPNRIGQGFEDQQSFLADYFKVAGITDPAQQAAFLQQNAGQFSPFLANLLGGADLSTDSGRAALQQQFAGIFQQLQNGTFNTADFGQLTGSQFREFIVGFTDLLGEIGTGIPSIPTGSATSFDAPSVLTAASVAETTTTLVGIEANTRRTADNTELLVKLLAPTAGGGGLNPDEMLAVTRDLFNASQGA